MTMLELLNKSEKSTKKFLQKKITLKNYLINTKMKDKKVNTGKVQK